MEADAREFGLFIDGLRLDRNLSREDLCEGIVSLSQYKRYLRGNTSIPNDTLVQLADRLKFRIVELHQMYRQRTDTQFSQINEIYTLTKSSNYDYALKLSDELKKENMISDYNKLFFDFCLINIQHNMNMVSDIHVLGLYSSLIDYPKCAQNDSFNWVEISILLKIVMISSKMDNHEPSTIVYNLMNNEDFIKRYSGNKIILPGMYSSLAQILGKQRRFLEIVEITTQGIKFCSQYEMSNSLAHLYMFRCFAYHDLSKSEHALEDAKKAFMQLYIENKPEKMNKFKEIFERRFEMNLDDLIKL